MLQVRQASVDDLDRITPLFDAYRQFYGQQSDGEGARRFLKERLERGESVVLVALLDGTAAGFTQLYPSFSSVSMARIFILNDLFVAAGGRRRGVGAALLHAAAEYGRNAGAIRLELSTALDNATAQSVYEANGWKRDCEFYVYHLGL